MKLRTIRRETVPVPKSTSRRIAIWSCMVLGPILVAGLLSCGNRQDDNRSVTEPLKVPAPERESISEHIESWNICFDRLFDSSFNSPSDFGRGLSREKMLEEMIDSAIELYRARPKGSDRESAAGYMEYFSKTRYSNGQLMYPNVSDVLKTSRNFQDDSEKRLAGRRVAISLRPKRFPTTFRLLHTMPHTAVTLVGMVNRPGGAMDVEHAEDVASLFDTLLGFQNRMSAETKLCDFRPNMSREQLKALDIYYSELIWNWQGRCGSECKAWESRDVPGMNRMEWVCKHLKHEVENGNHQKFGLFRLPEGFEKSYCVKREVEKREEREHYGRYGPFGVEGRGAGEELE